MFKPNVMQAATLSAIVSVLLVWAPLAGCSSIDPQSIDGMAEARGWTKDGKANDIIIYRVGDPSIPCGKPADGCEQHFGGYSVITTRKHWCSEPAGIIAHELAHACGWRHK